MSGTRGRLGALQERILVGLADQEPRWTLLGGAALVGFHVGHRTTRDLDLFWRPMEQLGHVVDDVQVRLRSLGLTVSIIRRTPAFAQIRVMDAADSVIVDLIAEPSEPLVLPEAVNLGDATIRVASRRELLATKLCTLLHRSEIRDLRDVRELLLTGSSLEEGLTDAPLVDAGFSAMTLAWVLERLEPVVLAAAADLPDAQAAELDAFRRGLIERLVRLTRPT